MICPSCGYVNRPGAKACESCWIPLPAARADDPRTTPIKENAQADAIRLLDPAAPVAVDPAARVSEVVRLLAENDIGCVLVTFCDALVGVFSERDLLMRIGDRLEELSSHPIRHFMTPAPEALAADDTITFALNRMAMCDFRHVPIEAGERPVGMVSVRDILHYIAGQCPENLPPAS